MMGLIAAFVTLSLISPLLHAEDAKKSSYILCRNQKVVRTVRISASKKDNEVNCNVIYAKDGRDKVVGEGRFPASCGQMLENIRKNLSRAGWKCRDISATAAVIEVTQE